ncbi:hypothetical protein JCM8097_001950 [Rhodosporidiobolus ruineniae]
MLQPTLDFQPFRPTFSDEQLAQLQLALAASRLPKPTYASRQEKYGTTHSWMVEALERWKNGFDWREYEKKLYTVDHYMTSIEDEGDEYKIHFIYHNSADPEAIPLVLLHGWPGSAFEFIDVVKLLRESTAPSFHLIVPFEPGYGWSSPPPLSRDTYELKDCVRLIDELAVGLGYGDGYAVAGGDIGSGLARMLAVEKEACKAILVNFLPAVKPPDGNAMVLVKPHELENMKRGEEVMKTGLAYAWEQGQRPSTLGIVVDSSPIATLAWLGEKYEEWTCDSLPLDEILAIATLYYLHESMGTSIWAYPEMLTNSIANIHTSPEWYLHKPFGFSAFAGAKKDWAPAPEAWAAKTGEMGFYRYHAKGGHFPGLECPEQYAQDLRDCFAKIWPS